MARTIVVAQQKGGAGKTTLVAQLAAALAERGTRLAVVDSDPQASLARWMQMREHHRPPVPEIGFAVVAGWRLVATLDRLARDFELLLVDTPPHAETEARVAVRAADLLLVPCQPSMLDIWASDATFALARREQRELRLVFNRVPPRGRAAEEAEAALRAHGVRPLVASLGNRRAFADSMARGLGVVELEPRGRAAAEIRALAAEVAALLEPAEAGS
jgi:chromosome partitioning protein